MIQGLNAGVRPALRAGIQDCTSATAMNGFLSDNFLLSNDVARRLYHQFAASQPILDYHCHLSPRDIAENRRFADLFEIWLEGDHYKWRAMRANGAPEKYITGDATPYEKFLAWARTVPYTLRNPLYHWTHLELQRYFDIHELLDGRCQRINRIVITRPGSPHAWAPTAVIRLENRHGHPVSMLHCTHAKPLRAADRKSV